MKATQRIDVDPTERVELLDRRRIRFEHGDPFRADSYPLYDALAMGVQMMVCTYILGRTDIEGRTVIDVWADSKANGRLQSALLSIDAVVLLGHAVYGSVFAPHLATKLWGLVNAGPAEQLFEGVPNQPE